MADAPPIPFGFKRIQGQAQKGDGVWSAEKNKFVKARKVFPSTEPAVIIRCCEVVQPELIQPRVRRVLEE